jgi:DNA-binding NarL/FixJ family response regulator
MVRKRLAIKPKETKQPLSEVGQSGLEFGEPLYLRRQPPLLPSRISSNGTELTNREREVVRLLAEGYCNKEVATTLNIAVRTVETHRARIMLKLNIHSLAHLVRYAVQNKMVVF